MLNQIPLPTPEHFWGVIAATWFWWIPVILFFAWLTFYRSMQQEARNE